MANGTIDNNPIAKIIGAQTGFFSQKDKISKEKSFSSSSDQNKLNVLTTGGTPFSTGGSFFGNIIGKNKEAKTLSATLAKLGFRNFVQEIEEIGFLDSNLEQAKLRKVSLKDLRVSPITTNNIT
jgi:hypothetical protein